MLIAASLALLISSPSPTTCQTDAVAAKAAGLLERATAAIRKGDYRAANVLLAGGLEAVNSYYIAMPPTLDDTGMKLSLAASEEQHGHNSVAASVRRSVLESRLSLYRRYHRPRC